MKNHKFKIGELCFLEFIGHPKHLVWIISAETSDMYEEEDLRHWMYEFRYAADPYTYGSPMAYESELHPSSLLDQIACPWPYDWDQDNPPPYRQRMLKRGGTNQTSS